MYEDKTLICKDCGKEFVFTAGEQEFYAEKGFQNQPQRCRPCRQARKGNAAPQREMYTGVCAACGKEARVPLPAPGRPPGLLQPVLRPDEGRMGISPSAPPAGGAFFYHFCIAVGRKGYYNTSIHKNSKRRNVPMASITKDTIIGDILDMDQTTAPFFLEMGMHCLGCPSSRGETVEQACMVHGVNADELVAKLNEHLQNK